MAEKLVAIATLIAMIGMSSPALARKALPNEGGIDSVTEAQTQATASQVVEACVAGQAETLPIPFSDVSPDHWAFEAVMTMYYCGVYRPPVPAEVIRQLLRPGSPNG